MTVNPDKTITISLDEYLILEQRDIAVADLTRRYEDLSKRYQLAMSELNRLAPMGGGVVLRTADRLICYLPGPVEQHQYEIRTPVMPSLGAMRAMREDLDFDKARIKCRVYRMTWQTTAHGVRIYEEVAE